MPNYRRFRVPGGTYFFTVNLLERYPNDLLVRHIGHLREAVQKVKQDFPFHIDAWVVLPDHLHAVWTLPPGDDDFSLRWRLIKQQFSRSMPPTEHRSGTRLARGERGIWQRRFWEHAIRNDEEYAAYLDYVHINPVKHGHATHVADWPYSSFHRFVEAGIYPETWATEGLVDLEAGEPRNPYGAIRRPPASVVASSTRQRAGAYRRLAAPFPWRDAHRRCLLRPTILGNKTMFEYKGHVGTVDAEDASFTGWAHFKTVLSQASTSNSDAYNRQQHSIYIRVKVSS